MRAGALTAARAGLLGGPVALAFFSGAYFDGPRLAALAGGGLVLALAALGGGGLPRRGASLGAIAGLTALAAWVGASGAWAPLGDVAGDDFERVALYAAALIAATLAWRARGAARAAEALAALGVIVVIAYGLAGRLLPGLVTQRPSASAGGRLDQPLTYWNATGALAAIGFVLCARIAGDRTRPVALRAGAVAGSVPLALGVSLSFSRGAIAALAAGLLVLLVLVRTRAQLRAAALCVDAGAIAVAAAVLAPGVRILEGSANARQAQGAAVLAVTLIAMAAGAGLAVVLGRHEQSGRVRMGHLVLGRRAPLVVTVLVLALVAVPVLAARGADGPRTAPGFGATSQRLTSLGSNRYEYWRVALDAFAGAPLRGVGSGGFRVAWLRERPIPEAVRDAHSLELETLAELGTIGALALTLALGGVALAARRAHGADPVLAAGPIAALATFVLHASIDWDWELPAVTLVAISLAGLLLARAARAGPARAR